MSPDAIFAVGAAIAAIICLTLAGWVLLRMALPADYPMVCPSYAKQRSELAKSMGLGTKREAAPAKRKAAA